MIMKTANDRQKTNPSALTTLTPPALKKTPLTPFSPGVECSKPPKPPLLVFTADEDFWGALVAAGARTPHKLVRSLDTNDTSHSLRFFKPGAVLLDLDPPSGWDAADSLLRDSSGLAVLLLTSRGNQNDFKTAIEAGALIDKRAEPARVLALAEVALEATTTAREEQNAAQQLVVRWLKPCAWTTPVVPLRRFWGINE